MIRQNRETYARFERQVRDIPEVVECYEVTGSSDYHLKFIVENMEKYNEIVETFLGTPFGVEKYFTYVVTRTAKDEQNVRVSSELMSRRASD
ncbi:MAG: Lrp/AsnC family transcriptional regulator [Mesorhizobium sp.]|nr:MAG: Lrp/AsnC family transcriptional regulator [Mesorhizobium sp.]